MPQSANPSDLRQELLAAFEVEYRDHLTVVRQGLAAARRGERADLRDIFRRLHSLKGAARAVDLTAVEQLAHELEAQMASVLEGGSGLSRERTDMIEAGLDRIEAAIEAALGGAEAAPPDPDADEVAHGHLRVEAGQVTDLVIATTQLAQAIERHDGLGGRLSGIDAAIRQARRALDRVGRRGEANADLADAVSELASASRLCAGIRHDLRDSSWALDAAFRRVRQDVDRMSLIPAETIFGPMGRMVREIARDEGVEVVPEFSGLGLSADRRVLQALKDPVLQLLRNAVSHGSERPSARRARGLRPATRITLDLQGGGGALTVTVSDDGPGPDLAAIRARAVERGLVSATEVTTEERLLAAVFEAGFSTRTDVGQLSGRGMGLSIVAEAARALGGTARMRFATGTAAGSPRFGTAVEITVALAVARQSAVLLGFGAVTVALPAAAVMRLLRVPLAAIEPVGGQMCVRTQGPASAEFAPVAVLGNLIGMAAPNLPVQDGFVKLAVIQAGAHRQCLALAVDHFSDVRRFLSHKADFIGVDPDLVAGLVMVTSEMPAALLSPEGLVARWTRRGGWSGETAAPETEVQAAPESRTILVVDDSITSRTLEKSILEAHGYRVMVAVDGVEALDILHRHARRGGDHGDARDTVIDMVLADVEMPRMDGFTLLQTMKEDPSLRTIPVIIMTSRDTAGDVRRGLDLGASAYIAKQSFDQQDLLGAIGRLL
jgi:two-component system chemotaxis sensor kinase CheA